MIINITRGTVKAELKGKQITVSGEGYIRGYGSPDYVIYSTSVKQWDPPHETEPFTDQDKADVLSMLKQDFTERNISLEIE